MHTYYYVLCVYMYLNMFMYVRTTDIHVRTCMLLQLQMTPLHKASIEGRTTTVQLLLEAKADINARDWVCTKVDIGCLWIT